MTAALRALHGLAFALALALLAACAPAFADTALSLHKTVSGSVNFTGTQVTLRTRSNAVDACAVSGPNTNRTANLVVPPNSTILWAQLYWAGSGAPDNTVTFEGKAVTATRKYTSNTVGGGMTYFGGAADVTAAVKAKKSGTYNFSGLTVSTGRPWCASQAVLGGFSLLVVYSNPAEPERVLNLYEGFRYVQNGSVTLTATNFRWPRQWYIIRERARIGHITWEGDSTLLGDGERLIFEGNEVTDDMNTTGNQFNSKSNINRDSASYGIDFDAYDTEVLIWFERYPSVTTTYRTGQDLVLLNAEILVLPTMPVSDLSIEMSRGGVMEVGQQAAYTIVVTNHGPFTEAQDVTVVDTLPAGMSYVSGGGTNWSCTASGQVVTCTHRGSLAPGTSAPPLIITGSVNQAGTMTNTAQVTGKSDVVTTNNSDSDTATATGSNAAAGYVFTSAACSPGRKVGSSDCPRYTATVTGAATAKIYVTAVNGDTTVALSTKNESTVSMQFSQSCINPAKTAGVKAVFAGTTLPACTGDGAVPAATATGAWSAAVNMRFAANSSSAAVLEAQSNFAYADVGAIGLNLLTNSRAASTQFISRPAQLGIRTIANRAGMAAPENPTVGGPGLARAGEDVVVSVGALLHNGTFAPNFGSEKIVPAVTLAAAIPDDVKDLMPSAGALSAPQVVSRSQGTIGLGVAYSEVGIISLLPSLTDYLTTGKVDGQRKSAGRFYPAYFNTVAAAPMPCLPAMGCPEAPNEVSGAVYSGQPFNVTVTAFNMQGEELDNYVGPWRKPITLSAVAAPGGSAAPRALVNGALGVDGAGVARIEGRPNYAFDPATAFSATAPGANNWTRPAAVYVRATATESTVAGDRTVTSKRGDDDISAEDGVMVLGGRLNVGSALGVATARTPMRLQTEYWTGDAWVAHNALEDTAIEPGQAVYSRCLLGLRRNGAAASDPNNCNPDVVGTANTGPINLARGAGIFWFRAPGAGRNGSAWVEMRGPGWLPSTRGRISFGAARRPLIYVREAY